MERGSWLVRGAGTVALAAGVAVAPLSAPSAVAAAPTTVVVAAVGDIACDPADPNFGGGNASSCQMKATANRVLAMNPSYLLPIGDQQYANGVAQGTQPTLTQYRNGYGASWGTLASKLPGLVVRPVTGNHEYGDFTETGQQPLSAGSNYFAYFGRDGLDQLPRSVTGTSSAWYSYDIPVANTAWHVVALDGECPVLPAGSAANGCASGSPQETWLAQDLAANQGRCTLAYIHEPRFAWGDHDDPRYAALWSDLVRYRATAVLSGHDHFYERFAPMDVNGNPSAYGVAQFIVGTGGRDLEPFDTSMPKPAALQAADATHFGVLKLTLQSSSAGFAFQTTGGATVDSGTLACNTAPPAAAPRVTSVTPLSGPSAGGTTLSVSGSGFVAGATVTVGGVPATGVNVLSATSLIAVAPTGMTTGDVSVTTGSGTSPPDPADLFTHTFAINGYSVALAASTSKPAVGGSVTLTATANQDVKPTPYFMSIIDTTTGGVVASTGSGRVFSATVSQAAAATKRYVAQIDVHGHSPVQSVSSPQVVTWSVPNANAPAVRSVSPISGPAAGGATVTVTGSGFGAGTTVSFGDVPATAVSVGSPTSLTATAPAMAATSPGTIDVTVRTPDGTSALSAADQYSYRLASNGFDVSLAAIATAPVVGGSATLTATANQDVGPTPYGLSIVDTASGTVIAHTGSGTAVRAMVTQSQATSRRYVAQIDKSSGPPLQASSAPLLVNWSGAAAPGSTPTVTAVAPVSGPAAGGTVAKITGTGFSPDAWVSFAGTLAPDVHVDSPTSLTVTIPPGRSTEHAVASTSSGSSPTSVADEYTYTQASNGYAITLSASGTSPAVGGSVTLTAVANQDLRPTPYTFEIFDATTGAVVAHAGGGTTLTATVSAAQAATRRYVAQIDDMGVAPIQAVSSPQIIVWS